VPAFQQRTPIRESKAIFEIQFYDAKNDTDDTPMALTIISRDSQYRLFKTIYDKITGHLLTRNELQGEEAIIIVFQGADLNKN